MNRRHRRVRLEILLGFALAGCAVDGGGEDVAVDMEPIVGGVAATAYPEAATLNIDVGPTMYYACSGTLIAPRVVLTAGHCVVGHHNWDVYVGASYRASTSAAVYDWPVLDSDTVSPSYHDVGLVFLTDSIALLTGFPTVATVPYPNGTKALNVGRDVGPNAADYQVTTSLYQAPIQIQSNPLYPYDYASTDVIQPGDSGGPVFLAGTHTILAVNSGAAAGVSEVMARVDLVAGWISTQVASHGGYDAGSPGADASTSADASSPMVDAAKADASVPVADTAKADANAPVVDAAAKVDASADAAAKADAGGIACLGATETEPNNTWPTANSLPKEICGALTPVGDVDWYSLVLGPGTHAVEIVATGDATMSLGIASGPTCTLALASATAASVSVSGSRATVCIEVASAKKASQSYYVVVAP